MVDKVCAPQGRMDGKIFLFPVRIYYEDTDAGGIVYYANYLKFAERARTEYLRHIGAMAQQSVLESDLCGFVVRHLEIDYCLPAKLDDLLTVSCQVKEIKGATVSMHQDIFRGEDVLCSIDVKVVYISLVKKRPMRIPEKIAAKF